jgi:hypothetical protein
VSLFLALTLPAAQIQWSGWVYFSMIILVALHDFFHKARAESGTRWKPGQRTLAKGVN